MNVVYGSFSEMKRVIGKKRQYKISHDEFTLYRYIYEVSPKDTQKEREKMASDIRKINLNFLERSKKLNKKGDIWIIYLDKTYIKIRNLTDEKRCADRKIEELCAKIKKIKSPIKLIRLIKKADVNFDFDINYEISKAQYMGYLGE